MDMMTPISGDVLERRAAALIESGDLARLSDRALIEALTCAHYAADLCLVELGKRGLIGEHDGSPSVPDLRPDSHSFPTPLTAEPAG